MRGRRWPWLLAALLNLGAGVALGVSTYLHWLPCRGSMLSGSIVRGFAYGPDFSDACLRRMDSGLPFPTPAELGERAPGATELAVVAIVLAAVAWLLVVPALRWSSRSSRLVATVPSVAGLALAVLDVLAVRTSSTLEPPVGVWLLMDAAAGAALLALLIEQPGIPTRDRVRALAALWVVTAPGVVRSVIDYGTMTALSDANWDVPPGTGYLAAVGFVLAAGVTIVATVRRPGRTASPSPAAGDLAIAT